MNEVSKRILAPMVTVCTDSYTTRSQQMLMMEAEIVSEREIHSMLMQLKDQEKFTALS
jgi:hypothetical protein